MLLPFCLCDVFRHAFCFMVSYFVIICRNTIAFYFTGLQKKSQRYYANTCKSCIKIETKISGHSAQNKSIKVVKIRESTRNKRILLHSLCKPDIVNANGCIDCANNNAWQKKRRKNRTASARACANVIRNAAREHEGDFL